MCVAPKGSCMAFWRCAHWKARSWRMVRSHKSRGDRVTAELIFRFRDGSIYRDETVFTQKGDFRLLSEHLVKKGPSFKQPIETLIDASSGQVTVGYTDHGKEETFEQKLDLPPDLANGLLCTILKHIDPSTPRTTVSMLVCTPKPRLAKIAITPEAEQPFPGAAPGITPWFTT